MTSSDLESGARGVKIVKNNYDCTVWPGMTEFGTVRHVVEYWISVLLGCQPRPYTKEVDPSVSKHFGTSTYAQTSEPQPPPVKPRNLIWWHILGCKSVFLGVQQRPHPKGSGPASPKILGLHTWAHTVWETANKLCTVFKLDVRQTFTRSTTNADARSVCSSWPCSADRLVRGGSYMGARFGFCTNKFSLKQNRNVGACSRND